MNTLMCFLLAAQVAAAPPPASPTTRHTVHRRLAVPPTSRTTEQLRALATRPTAELRVDVIEALIPAAAAEGLDVQGIAPPHHDVDKFLARLRQIGSAKLVLSDERPIVLGDEDIRLVASQQVPFVTREVPSPRGQMQRSISYQNVGAMVRLRTSPWTEGAGAKRCAVAANIEYSDMLESGVQISDGVFAPVFLKMTADQVIQLTSGKPALISCLQRIEGSKGKPAQFAVLIVRIELGAK